MATSTGTNNHSRDAVPSHEAVSGYAIATVIVGVGITLPAFVVGAQIVRALGLRDGAIATAFGGAFTAALAYLTMRIGAKTRLSTYVIVSRCFGRWGAHIVNLLLAGTLLGWYGVTVTLFGAAMQGALLEVFGIEIASGWIIACGGLLMVATTIYGFKAIDRLSRIAVPLLFVLLVYCVWRVVETSSLAQLLSIDPTATAQLSSIPAAVSVLIGSFIVGVTLTPDLARFSRKVSDALPASVLSYGIGYPVILLLAGLPALLQPDQDFIGAVQQLGLGLLALIVMVFATWTTNVNNLYSASLSAAVVFPRAPDWLVTLLCGVIGTAMGLAGIMSMFISFLVLLGVLIPPIAGVYLADYYGRSARRVLRHEGRGPARRVVLPAVLSWSLASAWGIVLYFWPDWTVSRVAAIDTLMLSCVIYLVLCEVAQRWSTARAS